MSHKKVIVCLREVRASRTTLPSFLITSVWTSSITADGGSIARLYLFNMLLGFKSWSQFSQRALSLMWAPAVSPSFHLPSSGGNKYPSVNWAAGCVTGRCARYRLHRHLPNKPNSHSFRVEGWRWQPCWNVTECVDEIHQEEFSHWVRGSRVVVTC